MNNKNTSCKSSSNNNSNGVLTLHAGGEKSKYGQIEIRHEDEDDDNCPSRVEKLPLLGKRLEKMLSYQNYASISTISCTDNDDWDDSWSSMYEGIQPQLYFQRWIQLGYLSVLALLSDWICFSVASSPEVFEDAFPGKNAETLITVFLFTNVATSFFVTDCVAKFGLQRSIQGAAVLMTFGCWLRSGVRCFSFSSDSSLHLMPYWLVISGTVLVGAAQPFFQCTPPVTSATWFAPSERAGATALALNFNEVGIATAYLVFGVMSKQGEEGLIQYFGMISVACTIVCIGTLIQFQDEPLTPPSMSELEKKLKGHQEPRFFESVKLFFQTPGFLQALAAFVCSISVINVVGAYIREIAGRAGIVDETQVGLAGAAFEFAIVAGGMVMGRYVDKTKDYKNSILVCLAISAVLVIPLGFTDYTIGKSPFLLVLTLVGLGFVSGPVQPIAAELAVDVTFPGDETAVESVQQIWGNLVSAVLVPVVKVCALKVFRLFLSSPWAAGDLRGDVVLLTGLAVLTFTYFSTFNAPLKRTLADEEESKGYSPVNCVDIEIEV